MSIGSRVNVMKPGWWQCWGKSCLLPLLLVLIVGAAFRLWGLDSLPPGLALDEAAEGLDARAILNGAHPVFLASNNGREPFFAYWVAAVMAIFGPGVFSIRLAAALLGLLSLPAAYLCFRALMGPRVALLGALALAISPWHLHLSRLGFRTVAEPLFASLAAYFLLRALKGRRWRDWVLAGAMVGIGIYTYMPARLFALVLAALPLLWLGTQWSWEKPYWRQHLAGFALLVLVASIVFAPLGVHFWRHPADFIGRADQVSVINAVRGGADLASLLWQNTRDTLLMFVWRGDANPRHNLPGQPVFDFVLAGPFLLGLATSLWRLKGRRPELLAAFPAEERSVTIAPAVSLSAAREGLAIGLFAWLWLLLMMVPAVLSDSAPHALRAAGLLPIPYLFVGLGLATLWEWFAGWKPGDALVAAARRRVEATAVVGTLMAASAGLTAISYFGTWAQSQATWEAFDSDKVEAAQLANRLSASELALIGPIEPAHPTLRFLLHSPAEVRLFGWGTFPLVAQNDRQIVYVVLGDVERARARLAAYYPQGHLFDSTSLPALGGNTFSWTVPPGSSRGQPPQPSHSLRRQIGEAIDLLGYDLEPNVSTGESLGLRLYWRAINKPDDDYLAFVHLVGFDGEAWAQQDREPGNGAYPTSSWGQGDFVVDEREIPIPPGTVPGEYQVVVGLYPRGGQRLEVRDEEGRSLGNQAALGKVSVSKASRPLSPSLLNPPRASAAVFVSPAGERLRLFGYGLDVGQVKAGESLGLVLYWQALDKLNGDYQVRLRLVGNDGEAPVEQSGRPVRGRYSTSGWAKGEIVRDSHRLLVPPATSSGVYRVRLSLLTPSGEKLHLEAAGAADLDLGLVDVLPRPRAASVAAAPSHPFQADLGGVIRFLGYDLETSAVRPGEPVKVRLYWQALSPVDTSYTVFVHLLDSQEKVRGQKDSLPQNGALPTTAWEVGQVVVDEYEFPAATDARPGQHQVEIGMYDAVSGARLPITDAMGKPIGDRLLLGTVEIRP